MLVKLCDSILSNINDDALSAIQNIAECARDGRHIVLAKRSLLQKLSAIEKLSDIDRRCFLQVSKKITQYGDIGLNFHTYIVVVSGKEEFKIKNIDGNTIYEVPIHYFKSSTSLQSTLLICEDLTDCDFYDFLGKRYIEKSKLNYRIGFTKIGGGGANTEVNYESHLKSCNTPCITIVDSDKKSDDAAVGKTAYNVCKIYEECKNAHITSTYVLPVREKENLIPPMLYYEIDKNDSRKILLDIYKLSPDIYYYGDIKSGLKTSDTRVTNYIENEIKKITKKIIPMEELQSQIASIRKFFPEDSSLIKVIDGMKEYDDNIIIPGVRKTFIKIKNDFFDGEYHENILSKEANLKQNFSERLEAYISKMKKTEETINSVIETMPAPFKLFWEEIGKMCAEWGCQMKTRCV